MLPGKCQVVAAVTLTLLSACYDATKNLDPIPPPTGGVALRLNNETLFLQAGETFQLSVSEVDRLGSPIAAYSPTQATWVSSNTSVVQVVAGEVRAINEGIATVTVSATGLASASLQVNVAPAGVVTSLFDLAYSGDRNGALTISYSAGFSTLQAPSGEWAAGRNGDGKWWITAVKPRSDGRLDLLEMWYPGYPANYLFVVLYFGMTPDMKSYEAGYSADPMLDAVRFESSPSWRLAGTFALTLFGGTGDLNVSGRFDVPRVDTEGIPISPRWP